MLPARVILVLAATLLAAPALRAAVLVESVLAAPGAKDAFPLVAGAAAPVCVDPGDWPGVIRAAGDLQADIERVTGRRPDLIKGAPARGLAVIAGTLGRSPLIDGLVARGKVDASAIAGRWEAFQLQVVESPLPGVDRALVIAGSDKRGTIYGLYELSEQIGVSPWYWWADVPPRRQASLFIRDGCWSDPGPVVRYRGLFLNDEAPALTGWVQEKFGGFDHRFYARVLELILRLRGNYLWPAMWQPRAFAADDPENPRLADEYGVVMGTSHHEPMMRAHAEWAREGRGPWNYAKNESVLRGFWRGGAERGRDLERIVTIGMRGDGDEAMSEETNVALLERIVADQRSLLEQVSGRPAAQVPQLWALYKEVQGYYERGMRVPDDVTLLWCDDNWGNIRRLPLPSERGRAGGAGVYYHFDYVGGPRNYKWLNVTPIAKVWEQMHLAWRHEATRIWIVNVGDLKPMEFPLEFFLSYAWNPARWPYERLGDYSRQWAEREFGPEHAAGIAALVDGAARLNRQRTPELLAPDTYSLVHYRESERHLAEWRDLVARADRLRAALPAAAQDAFFQLAWFPVQAGANQRELLAAAGLNRLYARQGRATANLLAERTRELFRRDADLRRQWDELGGGRWRHLMDQTHLGYETWQQPVRDVMPAVSEVQVPAAGSLGVAVEGDPAGRPGDFPVSAVARLPELNGFQRAPRWLEVFNRGAAPVRFTVTANVPWLRVSPDAGECGGDVRVEVDTDWANVPPGDHAAQVVVRAEGGAEVRVDVPVRNPAPASVRGFVEVDRTVAIDAVHFSRSTASAPHSWQVLPGFGRGAGGVTLFPVTAPATEPGAGPALEYDLHLFTSGEARVELHCAPSLDFQSGEGLRLAVAMDDEKPQVLRLGTADSLPAWEKAVGDSVRIVTSRHRLAAPGPHVLRVWMPSPGVVLERVLVDLGGLRPSHLGPPESPHRKETQP